jgi:transposase
MPSVADIADAVMGGDTHLDSHTLEIALPTGVVLATIEVSNDPEGFAEALAFLAEHAPGPRVYIGLEGTRSYGVGLARALTAAGLVVVEVAQPDRKARRRKGKSDPIDAHHAVLATLATDAAKLAVPRADGDREALRVLLVGRQQMTGTRTRAVNALRALFVTGADTDRPLGVGPMTKDRLQRIARRRAGAGETREQRIRRGEAKRLALAVLELDRELRANLAELRAIVTELAPGLLDKTGVGPVSGAQAVASFSHPGRCHSEAAFAALAGASPIPASSGKTSRHRLNYGGDRQLNRALHDIAKTRLRCDPRTRAYRDRRREGKLDDKAIRRCLKRYIARELYRYLNAVMA